MGDILDPQANTHCDLAHEHVYTSGMNYQLTFRSRFGQLAAWGLLAFSVVFLIMIWSVDGFSQMLAALPFPLGLAYFTWWIWSWPAVIVNRRGVEVRNQIRTWDIPWGDLAKAEARWGLYLYADKTSDTPATESSSTHVERPTGAKLTIGDVDPVNLDPDDLANKRSIYASAVPARGGLRAAARKEMPETTTLDLAERNRVTLRVSPMVAARIIEEEKHYIENPTQRPESHTSREELEVSGAPYGSVSARVNWVQIAIFAVFLGYWLWRIF